MLKLAKHLLLDLHEDELPQGFLSRMAANLGMTPYPLAKYMGTTLSAIVNGVASGLARLAEACQVDIDVLKHNSIRLIDKRQYLFRGQEIPREALSRAELRVCPICVREDMESGMGPPWTRPYQRATWTLSGIGACDRHSVLLITVDNVRVPELIYDFSGRMRANPGAISMPPMYVPRSAKEVYLLNRLVEKSGPAWLDALPFHYASKVCDVIGHAALRGPHAAWQDTSPAEWRIAGDRGYAICAGGDTAIDELLTTFDCKFLASSADWGLKLIYGRLYEWLSYGCKDKALDPLRRIMHEHIVENLPVGPGFRIFEWPVRERRCHSVYSLAIERGLPLAGTRRMGASLGKFVDDPARSNDRLLFSAEDADEIASRMNSTVHLAEVCRRLNIPRRHDRLLLEAGHLKPYRIADNGRYLFDPVELDGLWNRMSAKAVKPISADMTDIMTAAKRAKCSAMEIVSLLLDGKLERVGYRQDIGGYSGLMVDSGEVAPLVRGQELTGLNLRQVEQRLHTHSRVVQGLIKRGYLRSSVQVNPISRCSQTIVHPEDLTQFMSDFVSLFNLAGEHGQAIRWVKRRLLSAGIQPEFDPQEIGAIYYRRSVIPAGFLTRE